MKEDIGDSTIALKYWWLALLILAWRWYKRHWRAVLVTFAALFAYALTGSALLAAVVVAVPVGLMIYLSKPGKKGWWTHAKLSQALVTAQVLRKEDGELPTLTYKGKVRHDARGTTVVVALPQGAHIEQVVSRHKFLASALDVPKLRLHVWADPDDSARVIRIQVAAPSKKTSPPPVATAEETSWRDPVVIGYNSRGEDIRLSTFQHNDLFTGQPGFGKTATGRTVLGHFLLDPAARVRAIVDGKGSADDYHDCIGMVETYISGSDEDAPERTIEMLTDVLGEVKRRNGLRGVKHNGMLVVLEEQQEIRAATARNHSQLVLLDDTLGRVIRQGRAVGVHVLLLTQKPSGKDMDLGVRSNITQRLALKMSNGMDYEMALGHRPGCATPQKPGQAVWYDGHDDELITLYELTPAAWAELCVRAARLRTPRLSVVPEQPNYAVEEIFSILRGTDGLQAQAIFAKLSGEAREQFPTPQAIGFELRRQSPHRVKRGRGRDGNSYVWRLVESADIQRV